MSSGDFRSIFMPYCLQKQPDGRYVVLNRKYKPVGFFTSEHVVYENYPIAVHMRIGPATAAKLSYKGDENTDIIHLYNDGCIPTHSKEHMKNYLTRLEILAKLKTSY